MKHEGYQAKESLTMYIRVKNRKILVMKKKKSAKKRLDNQV